MRVIVNELQMLKQRTGIGHYTAELLRCVRPQAGADRIDGFPGGWVRGATAVCFRAGGRVAGRDASPRPQPLRRLRSTFLSTLRDGWQSFLDRRFSRTCAGGRYDLYHEPN